VFENAKVSIFAFFFSLREMQGHCLRANVVSAGSSAAYARLWLRSARFTRFEAVFGRLRQKKPLPPSDFECKSPIAGGAPKKQKMKQGRADFAIPRKKQYFCRMNDGKKILSQKLIAQNRFWSYEIKPDTMIPDEVLIEKTLLYLDLDDIDCLFKLFPSAKIKQVWKERLAIQGDYYRRINRFLAWKYFGVKQPDQYLKRIETQHINQLKCKD
jgi:hypothetical protein